MSRSPHPHGRQRRPHRPPSEVPARQPLAPQFMPDEQLDISSSGFSPFSSELDSATGQASSPINDEFLVVQREFPYRPSPLNSYIQHYTAPAENCDLVLRETLRKNYPHLTLTVCHDYRFNLLGYAELGKVTLVPNTRRDFNFLTQYHFFPSENRNDGAGTVKPTLDFGCFDVVTKSKSCHKVILYYAFDFNGWQGLNYLLHDKGSKEAVQELILEVCTWGAELHDEILVFQSYWRKDHKLWQSVQKASWKDVILDGGMKKAIIRDVNSFFSSKKIYRDLDVPWKRGLIFHGPPGNGKTISIKALMKNLKYPSLYVKTLHTFGGDEAGIETIFNMARKMAPCMLILEDLDSLINSGNRSYFLNQVDGIQENDGILVLATTNHLDQLDPGIVNRPSRFDRKYFFPMPGLEERKAYCQYWRKKLEGNDKVDFPEELVDKIAEWTDEFSFAYMKEAFVSSLLIIAARESRGKEDHGDDDGDDDDGDDNGDDDGDGDDGDDEESFETIIKREIEILRKDMDNGKERLLS